MTEAERIDFLIKTLEGGNAAEFGRKINTSKANVHKMRTGKVGIRLRVNDIMTAYPAVRREWLTTGEGYPGDLSVDLVRSYYEAKLSRMEAIIDKLLEGKNTPLASDQGTTRGAN